MTPGRKFSTTKSQVVSSRRTTSRASGRFRSSTILCLPALSWPNEVEAPSRSGGRLRIMSPSMASILMTSAPWSAISLVQYGPAMVVVKSNTRMPSKGPVAMFVAFRTCSHRAGPVWRHGQQMRALGGRESPSIVSPRPDSTMSESKHRAKSILARGRAQAGQLCVTEQRPGTYSGNRAPRPGRSVRGPRSWPG